MDRRNFLKLGAGATALAGAGLYGRYRLLPPSPSSVLESADVLAQRLFAGLEEDQRAACCVEYDHPLRQYHNRGVWGGGLSVFSGFDHAQRSILCDLLYAGLSATGRARVPDEYFTRWPGVHSMRVLICGDPTAPPYQILLTGAHLNLRIGGTCREGVAFGGPQVYGDQRGNEQVGLPGNLYRDQFLLAQKLLRALDDGRRRAATIAEAPIQTQIELQGRRGTIPGLPLGELGADDRALARSLVDSILSTWPDDDVAYARACLAANGGVDALAFSTYEHGEDGPIPEGQVFRLEGPAAVFYFRGSPHVHAFVNVAMDGDAPLSVGEPLGDNPLALEGEGVQELFERALRSQTGTDLAHYPRASVVGRLRAGPIRSGDIYTLESWQDAAAVVAIQGSNLSSAQRAKLGSDGSHVEPQRLYRVATTRRAASELESELGRVASRSDAALVRELTVAHLRAHPLAPAHA